MDRLKEPQGKRIRALLISVDRMTRLAWRAVETIRRGDARSAELHLEQACEAIADCLDVADGVVPQGGWPLAQPLRDLDLLLREARDTGVVDAVRGELEAIEEFRPNLGAYLRST